MVCRNCRQDFGGGPFCRNCGSPRATTVSYRGRGWAFGLLGLVVALVAGLVIWRVAAPPTTNGTATAGAPGGGIRPVPPTTSAETTSDTPAPTTATGEPIDPETGEPTETEVGPATSQSSGGGPTPPTGDLTVALSSLPGTTDPAEEGGFAVIWGQVFDTLTTYRGSDLAATADLADDWSSSADATEWNFPIVADRTFHDGTPVTAEAVCENFRYWDEQTQQADATYYDYRFYFGDGRFESCTADGNQAILVVTESMAALPDILTLPSFSIQAPDSLGAAEVVGSGPFAWVNAVEGDSIELAAVDGADAGVQTLTFRAVPDPAALEMTVAAGEAQLGFTRAIPQQDNRSVTVEPAPADRLSSLIMFGGQEAIADEAVRAALAQAIDREALVNEAGSSPAPSVLPGAFRADRATFPRYDPAAAKEALSGKKITVRLAVRAYGNYLDEQRMVERLTDQLETVGVTVEPVEFASAAEYYDALQQGKVDLAFTQWAFWMADVGDYIGTFRQPGQFGKLVGEKQAESLNQSIDAALRTPDYDERQAASTGVLTDLLEQNLVLPLYSTGGKWLVGEQVSGFQVPLFEMAALETVSVG